MRTPMCQIPRLEVKESVSTFVIQLITADLSPQRFVIELNKSLFENDYFSCDIALKIAL